MEIHQETSAVKAFLFIIGLKLHLDNSDIGDVLFSSLTRLGL
jgi:hypothetical protein